MDRCTQCGAKDLIVLGVVDSLWMLLCRACGSEERREDLVERGGRSA